jgi:Ca2+-transporting ATPase
MFIPLTFGLEAPLIASQLLWINLITDSLPAIALGMEPANPEIMLEKPRPAKESIFAERAGLHVLFGGLMIGGVTIAAFYFGYAHHGYNVTTKSLPVFNLEYARTMAFIVLVFSQLFYTITSRSHSRSIFKMGFFSNKYVVGAVIVGLLLQVVLIVVPVLRVAFHLQIPDTKSCGVLIILSLIPLLLNEIFKIGMSLTIKRKLLE